MGGIHPHPDSRKSLIFGDLFLGNFNPLLLLPSFSSLLGPKDPDFTPRSFGSVGAAAAGSPFWGIFLGKKTKRMDLPGRGAGFSIWEFREIKKIPFFGSLFGVGFGFCFPAEPRPLCMRVESCKMSN